jgi:hypothetical protein
MKLHIVEKKYHQNGINYIGNGTFINDKCEVVFAYEGTQISSYDSNFITLRNTSGSLKEQGKFGLITSAGKMILGFDWAYIRDFSEGLVVVGNSQSKMGFCDEKGNIKIPLEYASAYDFSNGLAAVEKNDKWGFIDKEGNVVIEFIWDDARSFSNGLAAVQMGDKWGYINDKSEIVIKPKFYWSYYLDFDRNGLAGVSIGSKGIGVIDKTGKFVLDPPWDTLYRDNEGNYESAFYQNTMTKYAFFHNGKVVGDIIWDSRSYTNQYGMTIVEKNNLFGLASKSKVISFPQWDTIDFPQWDTIESWNHNLLYAVEKNNLWGYINEEGKVVISLEYENAENFIDGLARVKKDGKYGLISEVGKVVIPFEWDEIRYEYQGLIKINKNNKWGLIDSNGRIILQPRWDWIEECSEGFVKVKNDGKWGFVDNQDQIIIEFIFDDAYSFQNGLAAVKKGDKWGYINDKGEMVIPFIWDIAGSFENYNRAIVGEKSYYNGGKDYSHHDFLITRTGAKIKYTSYNGISFVNDKILKIRQYYYKLKRSKYGFIDLNGNVLVELQFSYIKGFDQYGYAKTNNGYIYLSQCNQKNENYDLDDDIELSELISNNVETTHNESSLTEINGSQIVEKQENSSYFGIVQNFITTPSYNPPSFDNVTVKNTQSINEDKIIKYLLNVSRVLLLSILLLFMFGVITFDNLWIAIPSLIIFLGSLFMNWALTA